MRNPHTSWHISLAAAAAVLAPGLTAQDPDDGLPTAPVAGLLLPIHTASAQSGLAYGTWAAGPDYKVGFGDGVQFHPVLGESYPENLPLTWRTDSVSIGGQAIPGTGSVPIGSHGDWRYEYRYGAMTEAYDVTQDGVEQTFVLHQRPMSQGDLVVEGLIETPLRATTVEPRHGALVFRDDYGNPIVRYGSAIAIDAAGRQIEMATGFDGHRIKLVLDGAWLGDASFPVTVDPLLSSVVVQSQSGAPAARIHVARDQFADDLMVTYSRSVSASDFDGWAIITEEDFSAPRVVFGDVTAAWSTSHLDCAFASLSRKWIVVLQQNFLAQRTSYIRYHIHDSGDYTLANTFANLPRPAGATTRFPDVGGAAGTTSNALVVFQGDQTMTSANTFTSEAWGVVVNTASGTAGSPFRLSSMGASSTLNRDREHPTVNQVSDGDAWVCAWQEYNNTIGGDDWDGIISMVRSDGVVLGMSAVGNIAPTVHALRPRIAGRTNRYMVVYGERPNTSRYSLEWAPEIRVHRFDWASTSSAPTLGANRSLRTSRTEIYRASDIAFDDVSNSHWVAAYDALGGDVFADRLGFAGGIAESTAIQARTPAMYAGVTFNRDRREFPIVYTLASSLEPVYGRIMIYGGARAVPYGTSCSSAATRPGGNPDAGNGLFQVRIEGAPASTLAILAASLRPSNADLGPLGMPGCRILVDPGSPYLGSFFGITTTNGLLAISIPLPAPLSLDAYFQFFHLSPGANRLGLIATGGLRVEVR